MRGFEWPGPRPGGSHTGCRLPRSSKGLTAEWKRGCRPPGLWRVAPCPPGGRGRRPLYRPTSADRHPGTPHSCGSNLRTRCGKGAFLRVLVAGRCCRMNAAFLAPAASARFMGGFDLQLLDTHRDHEAGVSARCPPFRVFSYPPDTIKGGHRTRRFMESAGQGSAPEGHNVYSHAMHPGSSPSGAEWSGATSPPDGARRKRGAISIDISPLTELVFVETEDLRNADAGSDREPVGAVRARSPLRAGGGQKTRSPALTAYPETGWGVQSPERRTRACGSQRTASPACRVRFHAEWDLSVGWRIHGCSRSSAQSSKVTWPSW
jgi:hypothetical protein